MYKLEPLTGHVTVIPLKPSEVKEYTAKVLSDVETSGMDILQWGKIVIGNEDLEADTIVLYPKLASDKTNFGDPRQVIVEIGHIKARIKSE